MSEPPSPFGGGDPFQGMPMFRDLAKLFAGSGPVNWDIARQVALWVATEGQTEANVDPLERMRLEELARVADLQVTNATGLSTMSGASPVTVRAVGRAEWATETLGAYRPLLERLAQSLQPPNPDPEPDPSAEFLGTLLQAASPMLFGTQVGHMVGHLARRSLGQYGLPIPRSGRNEVLVVPANVQAFASDWSLPVEDTLLWVCLSELTHHAVILRPHVGARLEELLGDYVGGFRVDPEALEAKLGDIDPTDPSSLQAVLGDPDALLGDIQTPEQRRTLAQLETLVSALEGYVDHIVDRIGSGLIGSYGPLTEALRRLRVERSDADRSVERLFGLELSQARFDAGSRFVRGVVERGGDDALAPLWSSPRTLPTPADLDAPGLWIERISLPEE